MTISIIVTQCQSEFIDYRNRRSLAPMLDAAMLEKWFENALKTSGISQSTVATELASRLRRPFYRSTVSNMITGRRKISAEELLAIEQITGVPAPNKKFLPNTVPVVGKVRAGSVVSTFNDEQESLGEIEISSNIKTTPETVAAEIEGDCMGSFLNGWYVLWDRQPAAPSAALINQICVLKISNGDIMVKKLTRGSIPGTFTLESQFEPPLYDRVVEWATPVTGIVPR